MVKLCRIGNEQYVLDVGCGVGATPCYLAEEVGKIDLDAPVQHYLPWFRVADSEASAQMTVRHLLNQTSGLPTWSGETSPLALKKKTQGCKGAKTQGKNKNLCVPCVLAPLR